MEFSEIDYKLHREWYLHILILGSRQTLALPGIHFLEPITWCESLNPVHIIWQGWPTLMIKLGGSRTKNSNFSIFDVSTNSKIHIYKSIILFKMKLYKVLTTVNVSPLTSEVNNPISIFPSLSFRSCTSLVSDISVTLVFNKGDKQREVAGLSLWYYEMVQVLWMSQTTLTRKNNVDHWITKNKYDTYCMNCIDTHLMC